MKDDDSWIRNKLGLWSQPEPAEDLADRIVRRATAEPQLRTRRQWLRHVLEAAFSDWRYGLSYKVAGLAVCAILGLSIGAYTAPPPNVLDLGTLAFADADTIEGAL